MPSLDMNWKQLCAKWQNCQRCDLKDIRNKVVLGRGNLLAKVVIIGEAPGFNEDKSGEPFIGASGKLLDKFLNQIDWSADEKKGNVFITNVVSCRPSENKDGKNRKPKPEEIKACRKRLEDTLTIIRPLMVVLLGDTALKHVVNGQCPKEYNGTYFAWTYHPAYYLYSGQLASQMRIAQEQWRMIGLTYRNRRFNDRPSEPYTLPVK